MPRFPMTHCSQCGAELGPGDHGVSHCEHHTARAELPVIRVALHADSARERPLERPAPHLTVASSYLPGHIVLTLEEPLRSVVVSVEKLVEALNSL